METDQKCTDLQSQAEVVKASTDRSITDMEAQIRKMSDDFFSQF